MEKMESSQSLNRFSLPLRKT